MGNARSKLNNVWLTIALFVSLITGGVFNSFSVSIIVLVIIVGFMLFNGAIRPEGRGRRRRLL